MFMYKLTKLICLFSFFAFAQTGFAQKAGKKEVDKDRKQIQKDGNNFNWESLSNSNEVLAKLDSAHLSGTWKAYNGLFNFNGMINSMNLFKPFVIEISGLAISTSENSSFIPFDVLNNKLLVKGEQTEEGFINLLTDKMLVISWKNGSNYTRYYYERSE
jgi:hypothetical protein